MEREQGIWKEGEERSEGGKGELKRGNGGGR